MNSTKNEPKEIKTQSNTCHINPKLASKENSHFVQIKDNY